jgi:hypothetical protein
MNFALRNVETGALSTKRYHTRQAVANALACFQDRREDEMLDLGFTGTPELEIVEIPDQKVETTETKVWQLTLVIPAAVQGRATSTAQALVLAPNVKAAYRELRSYLVQSLGEAKKAEIQRLLEASFTGGHFEQVDTSGTGVCAILI